MNAHPLLRQLLIITFISGAVLLSFKYSFTPYFPVFIRIYTDAELNAYRPIFTKKMSSSKVAGGKWHLTLDLSCLFGCFFADRMALISAM